MYDATELQDCQLYVYCNTCTSVLTLGVDVAILSPALCSNHWKWSYLPLNSDKDSGLYAKIQNYIYPQRACVLMQMGAWSCMGPLYSVMWATCNQHSNA